MKSANQREGKPTADEGPEVEEHPLVADHRVTGGARLDVTSLLHGVSTQATDTMCKFSVLGCY